jgi:subtilase family serine protease
MRRTAALLAILAACATLAVAAPQAGARPAALLRACDERTPAHHARCFALWSAGDGAAARTTAGADVAPPKRGYGPADIASAYQLDQTLGAGQTIAIVDAFDNPKVEDDLAVYRETWGLPPCTTANGCFRKVNGDGGTEPPRGNPGWGVEIALDVQAVSAACPRCHILLVEARSASFHDIGLAVNTAARLGADVISNSYGGDEYRGTLPLERKYYTHPGIAQVASSGDFGFGPAQFPASGSTTIGVGGTSLSLKEGLWKERAWWGAGSGCSAWIDKPAWQHDGHCPTRMVADVSAVADPRTGLAVYDTFGLGRDNGWIVVGGTSLSSPLIAGMIGLAGNGAALGSSRYIYRHRDGLADVVGGSNGFCGHDYLCTGKVGYDGPTGLGSPRGTSAL